MILFPALSALLDPSKQNRYHGKFCHCKSKIVTLIRFLVKIECLLIICAPGREEFYTELDILTCLPPARTQKETINPQYHLSQPSPSTLRNSWSSSPPSRTICKCSSLSICFLPAIPAYHLVQSRKSPAIGTTTSDLLSTSAVCIRVD